MTSAHNRDTSAARRYHERTRHTFWSVRTGGRELDWANLPRPFKIYPSLDAIPLPREFPATSLSALEALSLPAASQANLVAPTLIQLAALLYFSAGITRRRSWPGGEIYFRAAACTGALYEIELYLVTGPLEGVELGIYHFNPADFALRRLREGDWRGVLVEATEAEPSVANAPALLVSTGIYWRNAWKYGARTYRHFGWDNGTLHANLFAVAAALGLPARLVLGFDDDRINRLLGLDTGKEVALAIAAIGSGSTVPAAAEIEPLCLETLAPSAEEIDFPEMRAMHAATLLDVSEISGWRTATSTLARLAAFPAARKAPAAAAPETVVSLIQPEGLGPLAPRQHLETLESVIRRRGSTRQFSHGAIPLVALTAALDLATRPLDADFLARVGPGARLNDLYVVANAVEGLEPGSYFLARDPFRLELLQRGNFRDSTRMLGLEQALAGDAAAAIFFLADLDEILDRFGNRGYRAVQLEAGILGGRLYLAAYAMHFGATGLTFYDDEVVSFFSPHAAGKSAIFLVALGRRAARLHLAG